MPAEPGPDWQQRKRSSLIVGDKAFASEDMGDVDDVDSELNVE